jgi:hypothetical protein
VRYSAFERRFLSKRFAYVKRIEVPRQTGKQANIAAFDGSAFREKNLTGREL